MCKVYCIVQCTMYMVALVVVWIGECEFSHALLCPLTHLHVVLLLRFIQSALIVHYSDITLIFPY